MNMVATQELIIPSNPQDLKDLKSEIDACVDAKVRMAGEQAFISECTKALAEKFEIPRKYINKLVNTAFKLNMDSVKAETDSLDELYTAVMEAK
jgi:hypothetical protein